MHRVPGLAVSQTVPPTAAGDWQRVDALRPGTRIVVTLKTGEKRITDFLRATADDVTNAIRGKDAESVKEETLPKSLIRTVATDDPVKNGTGVGALAGAGGMLALIQMGNSSCGSGCDNDMPGWAVLAAGGFGAGVGSLVGLLADRNAGRPERLFPPSAASGRSRPLRTNRFFPARPSVRVGSAYSQTAFRSSLLEGTAAAPAFALAVQVSPHISAHVEYTAIHARFYATEGSIPDSVLQILVPTSGGPAGWSRGIESRQVSYVFSELVSGRRLPRLDRPCRIEVNPPPGRDAHPAGTPQLDGRHLFAFAIRPHDQIRGAGLHEIVRRDGDGGQR